MDKIRTIRDRSKQEYQITNVNDQEAQSESIWNTLHEFGISKEDIMKQNLSHEELYNIHCAVKTYQDCQKVLKGLDEHG